MKAGELHILLHHFISPAPYPHPSPFYDTTMAMFERDGLVERDASGEVSVTQQGTEFVDRLKAVDRKTLTRNN